MDIQAIASNLGLASLNNKKVRTCTQDYIPIKDIINGVIITEDDRYIKVLEITPVNFALKAQAEQNAVLRRYMGWLRSAPSKFMIKCITKQTNIKAYVEASIRAMVEENSENCKALCRNNIAFLEESGKYNSVERHFYLIFEHIPENEFFRASSQRDILAELEQTAKNIEADFAAMGNKIIKTDSADINTAELLYFYYNRKTHLQQPLSYRIDRLEQDTMLVNNMADPADLRPIDIRDIVAPRSLDSSNPEYLIVDGIYRTHLLVKGNGFPDEMDTFGWLYKLISYGFGFDTDIFLEKGDTAKVLNSIRYRMRFSKLKLDDREEEHADYEEVVDNLSALRYIRQSLKRGGEEIYEMTVLVSIYAFTLEELYKRKQYLINDMLRDDVEMIDCTRFQDDAFLSCGPYNMLSPRLYKMGKHNMTTTAVAAAYPFTAFALTDKEGILLGVHRYNQSLVLYDPFDANKYANANMAIYGGSGRGKTYSLLTITTRLRCAGIQNFILAPDKQDEFRRVCDAVDGVFFDVSPSSKQRINVLDIWPIESENNELINGPGENMTSWLIDKIDNLKIWFQYLIPDITLAEKTQIGAALLRTYKAKGITEDNNSLFNDAEHRQKKDMPILSDLYEELEKETGLRQDILIVLSQFTNGSASHLNGHTNIDLDNKYIVFGLEHLKGDLQAPIMFLVLEYIWCVARSDKTKKKIISIDEGWKLLDQKNPFIADFVIEIFKVIRGYGGGVLFATQSIVDMFRGNENVGNTLLSCAHSNIILGMEQKDVSLIRGELALSDPETADIEGYGQGSALLCAGGIHIPIVIRASAMEDRLFTTKRSDLEKMAQGNRHFKKKEEE